MMADPGRRVYLSRRWDVAMLVCGPLMMVANAIAAISGGIGAESSLRGPRAAIGRCVTLISTSDLLVDRPGTKRAVIVLRAIAQLGFVGVLVAWARAAANGSGMAVFALASSLVAVVFVYRLRWAIRADRRDAARDVSGHGVS